MSRIASKIKAYGVAAATFAAVAAPVYCYFDREEFTVKIDSKERVNTKDSSEYRVYTDKGVFRNTDAWLFLKFDSADMQAKLKVGETFNVKANGFRIPFFSMFRNIITAEPIAPQPEARP